jgi:hypothetical protein
LSVCRQQAETGSQFWLRPDCPNTLQQSGTQRLSALSSGDATGLTSENNFFNMLKNSVLRIQ